MPSELAPQGVRSGQLWELSVIVTPATGGLSERVPLIPVASSWPSLEMARVRRTVS